MRLRVLIRGFRPGQFASLVVDVVMPLRRTVDAIGPVQTGVEPLRAVGGRALAGEHVAHLVVIGAGVFLGGEIAALPAPIGPSARQTVEDLLGGSLTAHLGTLGGLGAPQELGHVLFLDLAGLAGHACLAEILLSDHVAGDLAPGFGHFDVVELEHHRTVRVADL